jgi:hypothetical protein
MVPSSAPRNDITRCFTHSRNTGSLSAVIEEGLTCASSFHVVLMLSHTSRVRAVRTARPLLRAVFMQERMEEGLSSSKIRKWITLAEAMSSCFSE